MKRLGGECQIERRQLDRPLLERRLDDLRVPVFGQPASCDLGEVVTWLEAEEAEPSPGKQNAGVART